MHTQTLLRHYSSPFPNLLLLCALNHPLIFLSSHFPVGPSSLSLYPPHCSVSLSHTPFSLFNSVFQSKYYLTSFQQLSTSQQLFFPPLPCSAPLLIAVTSVLQWGELFSYVLQALSVYSFYMHVVATVRFTELKISREEFTAPGEKG